MFVMKIFQLRENLTIKKILIILNYIFKASKFNSKNSFRIPKFEYTYGLINTFKKTRPYWKVLPLVNISKYTF